MVAALGLTLSDLVPGAPIQIGSTGLPFLYVALKDAAAVDRAVSSGEALTNVLGSHGLPPVFLFAAVGGDRLYSRMFGPHGATRIAEDPATGSASGPVGAFAVRYGLIQPAAEVSLVSEPGKGTTFTVRIPAALAPAEVGLSLAAIRDSRGQPFDFQIVHHNEGASRLLKLPSTGLMWIRLSAGVASRGRSWRR